MGVLQWQSNYLLNMQTLKPTLIVARAPSYSAIDSPIRMYAALRLTEPAVTNLLVESLNTYPAAGVLFILEAYGWTCTRNRLYKLETC